MLKRTAFAFIFLSTHAFASDKVSDFLTTEIYHVDSIEEMQAKKTDAATKGILGLLEKERSTLKEALCEAQKCHVLDLPEERNPVAEVVGPIVRPILFAALSGWALGVPGIVVGLGLGVRVEYNTHNLREIKTALAAVEARIKAVEAALADPVIFPLEKQFLQDKPRFIYAGLNTKIEHALIAAYAAMTVARFDEQIKFLQGLMRFPLTKRDIAADGDDDAFRESLVAKKAILRLVVDEKAKQRAEEVLDTIATDNADNLRSVIYLRSHEGDELVHQIEVVARVLALPSLIVDASDHPVLDDAFCLGTDHEKGLYLSAFMSADPTQAALNPVLIVRNADEWLTNAHNLATMLKMADREHKSFASKYLGVHVDMHLLNVVFIGKADRKTFDLALASRLNSL